MCYMNQIIGTVIPLEDFLAPERQVISNGDRNACYLEAGRTYIIPDFQREIRWGEEQVIELINNIGDGSKFLGNIILSEKLRDDTTDGAGNPLKNYEIIDGQQRITTLLMILRFIDYKYGKELDLNAKYCPLYIESFTGFSELYKSGFKEDVAKRDSVRNTDDLNQIPHYLQIWTVIDEYSKDLSSRLRNKDTCQSLLENIKDSKLNVIINTSGKNTHGIKFFLDVNLKGKRLDTEDVFKSYLFYYDSSPEIRTLWVSIKKLSSKLTVNQGKKTKELYPLMEIIRHGLYCNLYKNPSWRSIEISNEFGLAKGAEIPGVNKSERAWHYRGEHIIDVLKNRQFMKEVLEDVEGFLFMSVDVYENRSPSTVFSQLFNVVEGAKKVDSVTISIAHAFIRRMLFDDNILPKSILLKYYITTLKQPQEHKEAYKWIFDVYAFSILFGLSAIKKQKELVLNIVSEKGEDSDWHTELSRSIYEFLKDEELSRAKVALQYKYADEAFNEECLSRGLAVLYNYFAIKNGKCTVSDEQALKSFLTNNEKYSLEHLIINNSRKYELSKGTFYSVQGESGKCVNSIFNFIFVTEEINNKRLSNKTIREKVKILDTETIDCSYSKKVLEFVKLYFINETPKIHTPNSGLKTFPMFTVQMSDQDKCDVLAEYFDDNLGYFFNTFWKFSAEVLKEVYGKITNMQSEKPNV